MRSRDYCPDQPDYLLASVKSNGGIRKTYSWLERKNLLLNPFQASAKIPYTVLPKNTTVWIPEAAAPRMNHPDVN
jgi:hypothetical protein